MTKRSSRPAARKPRTPRAAASDTTPVLKKGSALPAAAARFQAIIETSTDLICCYLPDGRLTYVNEAYGRFFGKPAQELVGRTFQPLIPVEDRPMIDRMLAALQARRLPYSHEHRVIRADGDIRWTQWRNSAITDGAGRLLEYQALGQDITERKRAEESLRQSLERFDLAVQGAHDGLWDAVAVSDDYFNLANPMYYSPRMKEIMGVEGDDTPDTIGTWAALVHPDDRDRVFAALAAHLTRRVPYDMEYRIIKKNGERRWIAAKGQALWDETGRPLRMAGSFSDITERRQLEDDLRQAQKMEAVGRLAGGIAHDFNNLLTIIGGCSDRLLRRIDPQDPLSRYVRDITASSDRAAALTRQLLAFSRRQVLEPNVLSLNDSLLSLDPILRRLLGEHIELALALRPDLGPVKADPGQIEQVILNLAINARDSMPNGGRLTIATVNAVVDQGDAGKPHRLPPGAYTQLIVTDTGQGMDQAILTHLFEPFFTTKDVGKGTGLGLATAYGIVAQSGGVIRASSEPGRGATFTVCLPQVAQAPEPLRPATLSGAAHRSTRGSETILLAEDEDTVRTLTRELLEEEGYRLLEARNGVEALVVARQHAGPIHLLLTDVVMPQMGGRALADRLTSDRPGLKVLYMSGYPADPNLQQGTLGAQAALLPKPMLPEALLHKIRDVLDASS
ncbi:MAG: PAS domain-containing protein [Nitrospirota bacterium]|nr:PAS domain-containing protein [Nitrospirota bacterium]